MSGSIQSHLDVLYSLLQKIYPSSHGDERSKYIPNFNIEYNKNTNNKYLIIDIENNVKSNKDV